MKRRHEDRYIYEISKEFHQVLENVDRRLMTIEQDEGVESQVVAIVRAGNLEMLQNLVESTSDSMEGRAVMWVLENVAFYLAALNGHLDILKYLIELISVSEQKRVVMYRRRDEAFFIAAKNGRLEILKYLFSLVRVHHGTVNPVVAAYKEAISDGKIEVAVYLLSLAQDIDALEEAIVNLVLPSISIEKVEYLLSVATPNQAVFFARYNITLSLAVQAMKGKAMHTLWYSLDCKVSKNMLQQIKIWTSNKASTLMYFSFLSAAAIGMEPADLGDLEQNILPSLCNNTPVIVRDSQAKSLLILDRMLLPVASLYSVCKGRNQFRILNLPLELMSDILWCNISEGIANLLPEKEHYLNVLGKICLFYSELRDDQIVIDLDNSVPESEYHISYALSFLCNLKNYIEGHNEKTL